MVHNNFATDIRINSIGCIATIFIVKFWCQITIVEKTGDHNDKSAAT